MINNRFNKDKIEFSCEVFPPKRDDDIYGIYKTIDEICELNPDFISVTYGAGGSNSKKTAQISSYIENVAEISSLAHMTAVGMTPEKLDDMLSQLNKKNVKRILCLRGDKPRMMTDKEFDNRYYKHASDLIKDVKKHNIFKIAAACYPECHPESKNDNDDLMYLKQKCECGVDELITQMFFDNEKFYRFREKAEKLGIDNPVHAGIMPITNAKMLGTSVSLSGSSVPHELTDIIAKYSEIPEDMCKAGIEYAVRQIEDLMKNGIYGIHLYSMNKSIVTKEIYDMIR